MLLGTLGDLSAAVFKYGHRRRVDPHRGLADVFLCQVISKTVTRVSVGEQDGCHLSRRAAVSWFAPCKMQNVKGMLTTSQEVVRLDNPSRACRLHVRARPCICLKDVLGLGLLSTDLSEMNHTQRGNTLPDKLSVFNQ